MASRANLGKGGRDGRDELGSIDSAKLLHHARRSFVPRINGKDFLVVVSWISVGKGDAASVFV
jgi:hypothetical protein